VVLPQNERVIGIHAFVRIDWANAIVRNMGVFIHPDFCSQGYGTETLQSLLKAVLESGICTIRLDVIANNSRAIQCYEKCGMRKVGEHDNGRFYWMEISILQQDSKPEKIVDQISDEGGTRCSRCSARLRREK
jgi:RimJ/RimL family protein N-acetyltransferase